MSTNKIIAVDGFSSCGKSTVAKEIAKRLNYIFIDSGAMYRAVTLYAIENKIVVDGNVDRDRLIKSLQNIDIKFTHNRTSDIELNGRSIGDRIRKMDVSTQVSKIATISEVRTAMVMQQRKIGAEGGVVMDGRDIGSVVFPDADIKLFMTADVKVRAERRFNELTSKGESVDLEEISENIRERDYIDQNREDSPLVIAEGAIVYDNSFKTREEQISDIMQLVSDDKN